MTGPVDPPPLIAARYRPSALLARSPHTTVFAARDEAHGGRPVALKIASYRGAFEDERSPFFAAFDLLVQGRAGAGPLRQEADALRRLDHPGLTALLDEGTVEGRPFLVTEWFDGRRLDDGAWPAPWEPGDVALVLRTILATLAHIHARGVVHRDVKPGNVLGRRADGRLEVKLVDFELALIDGRGVAGPVGNAAFRAPECTAALHGGRVRVDGRADLYAVGSLAYGLLAGAPPFPERARCLLDHATREPPDLGVRRPDAPPGLVSLIHRLLRKEPGERWDDAAAALAGLTRDAEVGGGRAPAPGTSWDVGAGSPGAAAEELATALDALAGSPAERQAALRALRGAGWLPTRSGARTADRPAAAGDNGLAALFLERERAVLRSAAPAAAGPTWVERAALERRTGRLAEALAAAQTAAGQTGSRLDALVEQATVLVACEQWEQALACCEEVLAAEPWRARAFALAAPALAALGRRGEAREAALAALRPPGALDVSELRPVATTALALGAWDLAVQAALDAAESESTEGAPLVGEVAAALAARFDGPNGPALAPALSYACAQLALRERLVGAGRRTAGRLARLAVAASRCAGADLQPFQRLQLAAVGDLLQRDEARRVTDDALSSGAIGARALQQAVGAAVPFPAGRVPPRALWVALALCVARQRTLLRVVLQPPADSPARPLDDADRARVLLLAGDPESALPLVATAPTDTPRAPDRGLLAVLATLQAGRPEEAACRLDEWDAATEGEGSACVRAWARALSEAGAPEGAFRCLDLASRCGPGH